MRLIDADKVDKYANDLFYSAEIENEELDLILNAIDLQETVDAAPVVRCKDCKYFGWEQETCHGRVTRFCKLHKGLVIADKETFCSYGERKDGGGSADNDD